MVDLRLAAGVGEAFAAWTIGLMEMDGLGARGGASGRLPDLEAYARRVEEELKERFGGLPRKELAATRPLEAYQAHFAARGKAYPVLLQAEAIASRGRRLEMPDPLVLAMFAAELDCLLLVAGHDLDKLEAPLELAAADGARPMPTLGGAEKIPPAGDLVMSDARGIVASVLLGPDSRTSLTATTSRALFVLYAPPGIGIAQVAGGLDRVSAAIALACPGGRVAGRETISPGAPR
jgi:DNA/RNA-binding domain of Phe-tRNA-synthetase-like protein